jgi:hypothetical protein
MVKVEDGKNLEGHTIASGGGEPGQPPGREVPPLGAGGGAVTGTGNGGGPGSGGWGIGGSGCGASSFGGFGSGGHPHTGGSDGGFGEGGFEKGGGGIGRPLVTADGVITAPRRAGGAWCASMPIATGLSADARCALADAWARDAAFEHASVASFARFALELMALGAPAHLVAGAHAAALDEVEHARLCYGLASRYGDAVGPGELPIAGALAIGGDLVALAVSTALEGCVGETASALLAREQAERATDPQVKAALGTIAEDEARHAELAWATLAWALATGGAPVKEALTTAFADAEQHLPRVAEAHALEPHGRLDVATARDVNARALRDVILPCAAALLA